MTDAWASAPQTRLFDPTYCKGYVRGFLLGAKQVHGLDRSFDAFVIRLEEPAEAIGLRGVEAAPVGANVLVAINCENSQLRFVADAKEIVVHVAIVPTPAVKTPVGPVQGYACHALPTPVERTPAHGFAVFGILPFMAPDDASLTSNGEPIPYVAPQAKPATPEVPATSVAPVVPEVPVASVAAAAVAVDPVPPVPAVEVAAVVEPTAPAAPAPTKKRRSK